MKCHDKRGLFCSTGMMLKERINYPVPVISSRITARRFTTNLKVYRCMVLTPNLFISHQSMWCYISTTSGPKGVTPLNIWYPCMKKDFRKFPQVAQGWSHNDPLTVAQKGHRYFSTIVCIFPAYYNFLKKHFDFFLLFPPGWKVFQPGWKVFPPGWKVTWYQ